MSRGAASCRARPHRTAPSVTGWMRCATMLEDACTRTRSGQVHPSAGRSLGFGQQSHTPRHARHNLDATPRRTAPRCGHGGPKLKPWSRATVGFRLGVSSPGVVCHQTRGDATLQHAATASRVGISSNRWHAMPPGQRWPLNPRSIQGACVRPRKNWGHHQTFVSRGGNGLLHGLGPIRARRATAGPSALNSRDQDSFQGFGIWGQQGRV
jgi:hypothetical protein